MNELSNKIYWDDIHKSKSIQLKNLIKIPIIRHFLLGFYNWEFYRICAKHIQPKYKNIFEVGCAPGNYLLQFYYLFGLSPGGVEYSKEGIKTLQKNFQDARVEANIVLGDFFDAGFLLENKNKHDIVYSMGFVEHFENPQEAIDNHFCITKKNGLVIITLPNLYYLNKYCVSREILDIHNLKIMRTDILLPFFQEYEILELRYFGGLFSFGSFSYKNWFGEKLRLFAFIVQRLLLELPAMLLYKCGINFANRYTSPAIMIICRKP